MANAKTCITKNICVILVIDCLLVKQKPLFLCTEKEKLQKFFFFFLKFPMLRQNISQIQ